MGCMQDYVDPEPGLPAAVEERESGPRRVTMAGIFRIPDPMWERIEPLIPSPQKVHRFGGGASRIPDRVVLDAIFFVLRTGCQWRALDATGICSSSTAHRRFQEWRDAGLFDALWVAALQDYDGEVGIDWSFMSIDGSMGKARWEAEVRARTRPTAGSLASNAA
jgi:transposase